MVAASLSSVHGDHFRSLAIPVIDLSCHRALVSELIVRACEEFGFFRVISHGVPHDVVSQMEAAASEFFSLPVAEKQRAGPPNPLGYGSKAIGRNGDFGEVEYLLLHTNPSSISQQAVSFLQMACILLFLRAMMKRENDGTTAASEGFSELNHRSAQRHATKRQTGAPKCLQQRAATLTAATATATTMIGNG